MKLNPLFDQVVIKKRQSAEQSVGGIIIPETVTDETTEQGTVVAVGPGQTSKTGVTIAPTVQVNDVVLFTRNAGQTVKVDGEEYTVIKEDELIGILN